MRSFISHPTDIPIEVLRDTETASNSSLRDISRGGLCFYQDQALAVGSLIRVRIASVSPAFEARMRVIWCQADGDGWQVGLAFLTPDDMYRARMVEQICHIEHYRKELSLKHGRALSGHEAALEWIEKYANKFPDIGPG